MLAIGGNVNIQFLMDLLCLLNFLIVAEPIAESISILIDQADDTLPLACGGNPMYLEHLVPNPRFLNPNLFLKFNKRHMLIHLCSI
jgi:hypothetical protein